jgi:flavin reductase (DIM6/NTAB) family NADH-FMN oxidoreductase RutF
MSPPMQRTMIERVDPYRVSAGVDPGALRRVMGRCATGVVVVTTAYLGRSEGVTANSFATVSLDPPLVLWSLARKARSFDVFTNAPAFAINVLATDQAHLSRHFATPNPDKFNGIPHDLGAHGCPILRGAVAVFECTRHATPDGGDHAILIGRVTHAHHNDGEPLIYHDRQYLRPTPLSNP